jgi:hypothetical protein
MSKKYPSNIIEQAQEATNGWGQINPSMQVASMNLSTLAGDILTAADLEVQIAKLEKQLEDKRAQRDAFFTGLWDKVKRVRNFIKGNYGDDSAQYKLVGGTRLSDKKPRTRKAAAE